MEQVEWELREFAIGEFKTEYRYVLDGNLVSPAELLILRTLGFPELNKNEKVMMEKDDKWKIIY